MLFLLLVTARPEIGGAWGLKKRKSPVLLPVLTRVFSLDQGNRGYK